MVSGVVNMYLLKVIFVMCIGLGVVDSLVGVIKSKLCLRIIKKMRELEAVKYAEYLNDLKRIDKLLSCSVASGKSNYIRDMAVEACYVKRIARMKDYSMWQEEQMGIIEGLVKNSIWELGKLYKSLN